MFTARSVTGSSMHVEVRGDGLGVAVPTPYRLGLPDEILRRLEAWLNVMYAGRRSVDQDELFCTVERFIEVYGAYSLRARRVT